jgi:hypothetical protein
MIGAAEPKTTFFKVWQDIYLTPCGVKKNGVSLMKAS